MVTKMVPKIQNNATKEGRRRIPSRSGRGHILSGGKHRAGVRVQGASAEGAGGDPSYRRAEITHVALGGTSQDRASNVQEEGVWPRFAPMSSVVVRTGGDPTRTYHGPTAPS